MRIALVATAVASIAVPALAQSHTDGFVIGNWRGRAHFDGSGRFTSCSIYARYRSGIALYFGLTGTGRFRIGFRKADWTLKDGSRHHVSLYVDGRRIFGGAARVSATTGASRRTMVVVDLPLSRPLFDRFRGGYVLRVRAPNGRMGFSLAGSNAALVRLVRCVAAHLRRKPGSSNPFAAPARRGRPHTAGLDDDAARLRAVTLIANVLSRAAIGRYEIVPLDEMPPRWRRFHALWRTGKTIGLVRLYRGTSVNMRRAVYAAAVAADLEHCKGSYQSGVKRGDGPGRPTTFFSRCAGEKDWSIYYFVIGPDKSGIIYLVGLYSPDKNEPLELGERLRRAVTAIVLKKPVARQKKPEVFQQ
jgi:hypothetical protein